MWRSAIVRCISIGFQTVADPMQVHVAGQQYTLQQNMRNEDCNQHDRCAGDDVCCLLLIADCASVGLVSGRVRAGSISQDQAPVVSTPCHWPTRFLCPVQLPLPGAPGLKPPVAPHDTFNHPTHRKTQSLRFVWSLMIFYVTRSLGRNSR